MSDTPTASLREVIGDNVRRLRTAANAAPDDVIRSAKEFGLEWTPSFLQALERGQRAISAEHLLLLPPILTKALAHRVSLADLLLGDAMINIGERDPMPASTLREIVTAPPFRRSFTGLVERDPADENRPTPARAVEKTRAIIAAGFGTIDMRVLAAAEAGSGTEETKLAKKLGVPEIVVIAAAASLWGSSLTEQKPYEAIKVLTAAVTERIGEAARAVAQI